jgi:hypothetical protein
LLRLGPVAGLGSGSLPWRGIRRLGLPRSGGNGLSRWMLLVICSLGLDRLLMLQPMLGLHGCLLWHWSHSSRLDGGLTRRPAAGGAER